MDQKEFIDLIAPWAQAAHKEYQVPASVTIAQAALESGWGESLLAKKAKALFGIKYGPKWNENLSPFVKGSYSVVSKEYLMGTWVDIQSAFCMYDSWADSVLDHGPFLKRSVYDRAFLPTVVTADDFARAIHAAGYATDPTYSDKLINLMKAHDLYQYDIKEVDTVSSVKDVVILGASKQGFNQYAGGPSGVEDSEFAWMQKLAEQTGKELSPYIETHVVPGIDVTKNGVLDFNDNVTWATSKIKELRAQGKRIVLWNTLHSNAMGDSMVLGGQSTSSLTLRKLLISELNANNIMPFWDIWTPYDRLVSEMAKVDAPSLLTEFGQHDRVDYADWLRAHISDGTLAKWYAKRILTILNIRVADPLVAGTPNTPAPAPDTAPAYQNAHTPMAVDGIWWRGTTRALQHALRNKYNAWGIGAPLVIDGVEGKNTYRALQRMLNQETNAGLQEDGQFGPTTKRALQRYLGVTADGIVGRATINALQTKLNNGSF